MKTAPNQRLTDEQRDLAATCFKMAVSLARSNSRSDDDLEECYDASFRALIGAARKYDPSRAKFSTYAHIGISLGLRTQRIKASRRKNHCWYTDHIEQYDEGYDDPEFDDEKVSSGIIASALEQLPDREREIVTMRLIDGKTLKEVGERFGICKERIRQIQEAATKKLRELLADQEWRLN
jgi:RNA polymerase sigma factor (sigma-70 family)